MTRRERARQIALQALYQFDLLGEAFGDELDEFLRESTRDPKVYFFARELARGTRGFLVEADRRITEAAEHWGVDRMATIDRNVLRLATYEICCQEDTPNQVVIDQAIELAKRFGTAQSGAFVNGILDKVMRLAEGETGQECEAPSP
ncbi:MAG: transcription antitermination factor NusB [Phycisphaerae bacterium]|jgi:N utilization substance protein B|nr:transcription antitermination factor NusB [Phycisphaerae bacterium]